MRMNEVNDGMNNPVTNPINTELHLFGIDHHRASTRVREAAYLEPDQIRRFQKSFAAEQCGVASVVLCTCNRTEIYLEVHGGCRSRAACHRSLGQAGVDSRLFLSPPGQHLSGDDVVHHLYRVTAGLESMVLGESQISAQVKSAYRLALESHRGNRLGSLLMRAFQGALRAGKRVRTETGLSAGPVNVATIAVEEANRQLCGLDSCRGLLIGAGKTGTLAARHLLRCGIRELTIVNRSRERAESLAGEVKQKQGKQVRVRPFGELGLALAEADVVLSATGSSEPIIDAAMIANAVQRRNGTPLYLFDLAVPRDVASEVAGMDRVRVVGLDQISQVAEQNLQARRREIPRAESIVAEELREYAAWASTLQIGPAVKELRAVMEAIAEKELDWVRRKQPAAITAVVEQSLRVFIKRLLQRPVLQLKSTVDAADRCQDLDCLQRLFKLDS